MFFDEIDSLLPRRSSLDSAGGNVMDRIVSQFLTEMDSISRLSDVFVIGATNRKDLIDPSLLRSGRFDKHLMLGNSSSVPQKLKVFDSVLHSLPKDSWLLTEEEKLKVLESFEVELSGAEIHKIILLAYKKALKKKIYEIQQDFDLNYKQKSICLYQYINFILPSDSFKFQLTLMDFNL